MLAFRYSAFWRSCAAVTLILFLFLSCSKWEHVSVDQVEADYGTTILDKHVRFHAANGSMWDVKVLGVDFPIVTGTLWKDKTGATVEVDLRQITQIDVYGIDGTKTTLLVVFLALSVVVLIAAIAASEEKSSPPPSSGSSCPIVYVRAPDATHRVGEAYAGAAFRSVQRNDLLPVPSVSEPVMHCVFVNEAREVQYTDQLQLVVVDHPTGTRAVSTVDQAPMLVENERGPVRGTDALGNDVTAALAHDDDRVVETDWTRVMKSESPPLRESITATFPRPDTGGDPVLELVMDNSYWLDFTLAAFFAGAGGEYGGYMNLWNDAGATPWIQGWLAREGVSLTVEQRRGEQWETVAVVPPVGPVALRRVAVPLRAVDAGSDVEVRVSGGTGFWRVDQMALATASAAESRTTRVAPSRAVQPGGQSQLDLVATTDGRYQVLKQPGDRLDFDFAMPPMEEGMTRSTFLFSNGYYNIDAPPAQQAANPSEFAARLKREGGLASLGIDLYHHYDELARKTPLRAQAVTEVRK